MDKENASHAIGTGTDFGGTRQRNMIGAGKGPLASGDFGIGNIPGTARIKGDVGMMGTVLSDRERGAGPGIRSGDGKMRMTANSDHGSHR